MNQHEALLVALNALQAIDEDHPYPIAKHAIVQISKTLAQSENLLDIADRAYFAGKQDGIDETIAQPTKSWVGLDDKDFQYQTPQYVLTMKFAEAILRDRNE